MADTPRFSRITVTPDDEDDFVIQAGAAPEPNLTSRPEPQPEHRSVAQPAHRPECRPEPQPAPARQRQTGASSRPAKGDSYRETTLADIEGSKMPAAQKAVIVLAVLGIVAFVAWYLLN